MAVWQFDHDHCREECFQFASAKHRMVSLGYFEDTHFNKRQVILVGMRQL
jgi:hypothetical protein